MRAKHFTQVAVVMLVILATVGMTASFTTVAQGSTIYAGDTSAKTVKAFDMDGTFMHSVNPTAGYGPYGLAHSPDLAYLYISYMSGNNYTRSVAKYEIATDSLTSFSTFAGSSINPSYPLGVDSTGNIYTGANSGVIDKIAPDGTRTNSWGTVSAGNLKDFDVRDGYLYLAAGDASNGSIWKWDLSTGGAATAIASVGFRSDGIAFGPDGAPYTSHYHATSGEVRKWALDFSSYETIASGTGVALAADIDYFDGALYLSARTNGIKKYDLSAESWSTFVTGGNYQYTDMVVPEPSTLVLLTTGLIGLLCYAWRKRK